MKIYLANKNFGLNLHSQNDPWCNGSTPVFGIVSQGSSPCGSTAKFHNSFIKELWFFYLKMRHFLCHFIYKD